MECLQGLSCGTGAGEGYICGSIVEGRVPCLPKFGNLAEGGGTLAHHSYTAPEPESQGQGQGQGQDHYPRGRLWSELSPYPWTGEWSLLQPRPSHRQQHQASGAWNLWANTLWIQGDLGPGCGLSDQFQRGLHRCPQPLLLDSILFAIPAGPCDGSHSWASQRPDHKDSGYASR